MNRRKREMIAGDLLTIRGWLSCVFPIGETHGRYVNQHTEDQVTIRAGNLKQSCKLIDKILKHGLRHIANGRCSEKD